MRPDHLLTARISLSSQAFNDRERLRQFWIRLNEKLTNTPGIVSATLAAGLPPERRENDNTTDIENFVKRADGPANNVAFYQSVGDNFFETLGARLLDGRFFDARDGFGAPSVMIVNQAMAKTFWPGQSAVGKRVRTHGRKEYSTIVGVVADIRNGGMSKPAGTELFEPARQETQRASQGAYANYANGRQSGTRRQHDPGCRGRHRPVRACVAHPHHGGCHGRFRISAAIPRTYADRLLVARPCARGLRNLRSHFLLRRAANFRIWHSHGVRCEPGHPRADAGHSGKERCSRFSGLWQAVSAR